jgi:hypothetical protein
MIIMQKKNALKLDEKEKSSNFEIHPLFVLFMPKMV